MTAARGTRVRGRAAMRAIMAPAPLPVAPALGTLTPFDIYDLTRLDLSDVGGIAFTGDVDQLFLVEQQPLLDEFVGSGGRVLVNGHVQRPFITGLTKWRRLSYNGAEHLRLHRVNDHPVWAGTEPDQFLYNTGGAPRPTDPDQLARVGVAGFYGRGYYLDLPEGATVIHTIGAANAPIDYEFCLGRGRVLVHGGNDLAQFMSADRGTAHMHDQLCRWLEGS